MNMFQRIKMWIFRVVVWPLGHRLFMILHLICVFSVLAAILVWITSLKNSDMMGGWILAVLGIYVGAFALIEDARHDARLQAYFRISSKLSKTDWEILATIRSGFHTISDIERVIAAKIHASRAEVFRGIATLLKRGYIVDDGTQLRYYIAPIAVQERSIG